MILKQNRGELNLDANHPALDNNAPRLEKFQLSLKSTTIKSSAVRDKMTRCGEDPSDAGAASSRSHAPVNSQHMKLMSSAKWRVSRVKPVKPADMVKGLFDGGMGVEAATYLKPASPWSNRSRCNRQNTGNLFGSMQSILNPSELDTVSQKSQGGRGIVNKGLLPTYRKADRERSQFPSEFGSVIQ